MTLNELPRVPLAHLPTPLEELPRLTRQLGGPRLLIKRDDQTGLATGGNKSRKLEYLVADALAQGADILVTAGAIQSNHCRQSAAAAARVGLACTLVLGGEPPARPNGNLLLDQLLGAELHWAGPYRRGERLQEVVEALRARGHRPYFIPYGGSNEIGAAGYVRAMVELGEQLEQLDLTVDRIVVASSSGATQAGMVVGARLIGFTGQILGIGIDKGEPGELPYPEQLASLARATATRLGLEGTFHATDFLVNEDYLGAGYGQVGELEREAIRLLARSEGILVDPVYTARALGALLDLVRRGEIGREETVLFWHTGGTPALFAYAESLL